MSTTRTHPPDDVLHDFLLGKLPDLEEAEVEDHLAKCPECQQRAATTRVGDTLVELLASAGTRFDADRAAAPTPTLDGAATPSLFANTQMWDQTAAPDPAADVPAVLAGHPKYRVVRRLGQGGMGTVWLAEHTVMNRPVAVKVIRPEFLAKPGATGRFLREVRAAAKLHHPNIVTAYDAESVGDSCLLVMEYVDGETLADQVKAGPLSVMEVCRAIRDAARGLAHAHAAGLVHRDVKPHNLMRATDGTVKVLDFGLAGVAVDEGIGAVGDGLSVAGMVCGTPDYIAPEQIADPHAADARSDIYGLGCTCYHLLTGHTPFCGATVIEKLAAQENRMPDPIPDLAPELAAILVKMLAKRPEDRYQTADEVVAALEAVIASLRHTPPRAKALVKKPRSRMWAVAVASLLFFSALAAGVVFKIQRDNQEITIATDDPDIEVVMKRKGEVVRIRDTKTGQTWELNTLTNQIGLADSPDGLRIDLPGQEPFILRREGKEVFRITRLPKPVGEVRRFQGHESGILSVAVSPDGLYGASGGGWPDGKDFTVRIWELASGKELQRLEGHTAAVFGVVFSPDGKQLLSCSLDGTARLWDPLTGKELVRFDHGDGDWRVSAAFSPDGRTIVTGDHSFKLRLWDTATGKEIKQFAGHKDAVRTVAFLPNGRRILSGSYDGTVRLWDVETGKEIRQFPSQNKGTYSLAVFKDGMRALYGDGPTIRLVNLETGEELRRLEGHDKLVFSVAISPDGSRAISGSTDQTIRLWDLRSGKQLDRFVGHGKQVSSVAFTPDGKMALSGGVDKFVRLWRLPKPPQEKVGDVRWLEGYSDVVWSVAFSPDGARTLTTGGLNQLCDRVTGQQIHRFGAGGWFATFSPTGDRILSGEQSSQVAVLWDAASGKEIKRFGENLGRVVYGVFSPDGSRVAVNHGDKVRVWDVETEKELAVFSAYCESRPGAVFTRDGKGLLVVDKDQSIRAYNTETWKETASWAPHAGCVTNLALSPDGTTLLTATTAESKDQHFFVWDVASGKRSKLCCAPVKSGVHEQRVSFLPDGRHALYTNDDGTMILWDVPAESVVQRWKRDDHIVSVAIAPDGKHALCGTAAKKAFLFRLPDLQPVDTPDRKALLDVTDFREVHGVDAAALKKWLEGLPAGFRPLDINPRSGSSPPLFDALAVADPRGQRTRELQFHFGLDGPGKPRHRADFETMTRDGWELRVTCPYEDEKLRPRHHIWTKGEDAAWSVWGLELGDLPGRLAAWKKDGSRPIKFYLNNLDPGRGSADRPYAVFVEPDQGLDWKADTELTADELTAKIGEARRDGRRPDALSDLGDGSNRTYCLSVVPNPTKLKWEFRTGMTAAEYQNALEAQKNAGLRPLAVRSEVVKGQVRYMVVWIEYSPRR